MCSFFSSSRTGNSNSLLSNTGYFYKTRAPNGTITYSILFAANTRIQIQLRQERILSLQRGHSRHQDQLPFLLSFPLSTKVITYSLERQQLERRMPMPIRAPAFTPQKRYDKTMQSRPEGKSKFLLRKMCHSFSNEDKMYMTKERHSLYRVRFVCS